VESKLTITLTADGQLQLQATGPAGTSKILMLGMLEMTKAVITAPQPAGPPPSPLLVARGALPNGR